MDSITFSLSLPAWNATLQNAGRIVAWALCGFSLVIALGLGLWWLGIPGIDRIVPDGADKIHLFWPCLAVAAAAAGFAVLGGLANAPGRNFLLLDDQGLTYVMRGKRWHWPWRDVADFEVRNWVHGVKTAKLTVTGRFDWKTRLALLLVNGRASSSRLTVFLGDIYDTPLDDIAARLKAYRGRSSAGAPGRV